MGYDNDSLMFRHKPDGGTLHSVSFHQSFAAKLDPTTGAFQSITVSITASQRSLTLNMWEPDVYIRGPWTFPIKLRETKAAKPRP